jgi:hypothetical protein
MRLRNGLGHFHLLLPSCIAHTHSDSTCSSPHQDSLSFVMPCSALITSLASMDLPAFSKALCWALRTISAAPTAASMYSSVSSLTASLCFCIMISLTKCSCVASTEMLTNFNGLRNSANILVILSGCQIQFGQFVGSHSKLSHTLWIDTERLKLERRQQASQNQLQTVSVCRKSWSKRMQEAPLARTDSSMSTIC